MSKDLQTINSQKKLALWAGRISECRNSGQKVKAWCKENGVCEQTYYKWQRRLFELAQLQQEVQFAEITPAQSVRCGNIAVIVRIAGTEADIHLNKKNDLQTSNAEMVTISRAEYEEKNARLASQDERISRLENQVELLTEALRLSRHKQFGASSEKSDDTLMEQLSFLFDEAEVYSAADKETENVTVVAAHKRHKKHEYTLDSIPEGMQTKQVEHRLEGDDLVCPQCGDTMTKIGKEVVRTLEIIPAQMVVREDIYYTYHKRCPPCG